MKTQTQAVATSQNIAGMLGDRNVLITGGTRMGKSGLMSLISIGLLRAGEGITAIDPHGSFVRYVRDWMANPENGQHHRKVHYLDPGSPYTIGINPLRPFDDSWEACHAAAIALSSAIESRYGASPEETPRLTRLIYVAGMLCARHGLTIVELQQILSIGGSELRLFLLQDCDHPVVRRELEELQLLATKSPREFLAITESSKNRVPLWLGHPSILALLGQKQGLDPLAVMDRGEVVLADLSSLTHSDASLVGTIITSTYFAAARRRQPLNSRRHRTLIDEAESMLTVDVARSTDQLSKFAVNSIFSVQRLGQLRNRGDNVFDALITNCAVKVCFGGQEFESARYMAQTLFAGHVDLEDWKPASVRPVAVGNEKVTLRGRAEAQHHADHSAAARSSVRSNGRMTALSDLSASSWGSVFSSATSTGSVSLPEAPVFSPPTQLSSNASRNRGQSASASGSRARGRTSAHHVSHADASSTSHGSVDGTSRVATQSEAYITRYEDMPTQMYTLEEQLFRLAGELASLPRRECFVRVDHQPPLRMRTADLPPAFRSAAFQEQVLPLYMAKMRRISGYVRSLDDVEAEIAARLDALTRTTAEPDPDFTQPEPSSPQATHLRVVARRDRGGTS